MKQPKKPERPKPWSPWESRGASGWIVLEPVRLAPLGGTVAGVLALAYFLLRQSWGEYYSPGDVLVGAGLAFVVGYAATGLFVWYLLHVIWRELPEESATATEESDTNHSEPKK